MYQFQNAVSLVFRRKRKNTNLIFGLCREDSNGQPWEPKKDFVCSDHFQSGQHSNSRYDNDYVPTIFPGNKSRVLDIELAPIELSESTSVPADKKLIDMDHGMYLRKHNSIFCYHYCLSNVFI